MTARFVCFYCHEPLKKKDSDFTEETFILKSIRQEDGLLRVFHNRCVPNYAPPDSPLQAAVQKAKQAIADAHRLPEEQYEVFAEIVGRALTEQRQ